MLKHNLLLLAAVDQEIIKVVVLLVLAGLAGLGKLLAGQKVPPGQRPRPAQPPPADVADEIEAFLRRAAQRQEAPKPTPAEPVRQVQATPRKLPPRQPRQPEQPILAEAVGEKSPKPVGGQVTEHVKKYLDTEEFGRRTARLGDDVAQTDREIDQHLHQVFDHALSRLTDVPGEAASPPTAVAPPGLVEASPEALTSSSESLLAFFTDPDTLCQAVVLSEILHRPEERW
jgi:hypothetical protein